ncbi:MAG TPA: response regulator [Puia sp.]|nr:response regulator [Puia sp.]
METTQQPRIFVVEDNLLYQQLIGKELESLSNEIYYYTTGEACLQDLHKQPSIVVLDYNLDGEINGLDTLQEIRKFNPEIYVILFSSQKNLQTRENIDQYGSFNYLEKRGQSFRLLRQMIKSTYFEITR